MSSIRAQRWKPPEGALGELVRDAGRRAAALESRASELRDAAAAAPAGASLRRAIEEKPDVAVVAEVKRRSPSRGQLAPHIDAAARARAYQDGGAAAISILTEWEHFGGNLRDLELASQAVSVPAIRKDFHVSPLQLLEARAAGASAALLIARAVAPGLLMDLVHFGAEIGLETLVEIRSEAELHQAYEANARIIGVNSRDLESLEVDVTVSRRLVGLVSADRIAVFESGIESRSDVELAAEACADAVLVGSSLSVVRDGAEAVRILTGVKRHARTNRD